tara:strand:- start:22 stop:432 length:411 start_codon:yes stop_codon:yes gene_type:complete
MKYLRNAKHEVMHDLGRAYKFASSKIPPKVHELWERYTTRESDTVASPLGQVAMTVLLFAFFSTVAARTVLYFQERPELRRKTHAYITEIIEDLRKNHKGYESSFHTWLYQTIDSSNTDSIKRLPPSHSIDDTVEK